MKIVELANGIIAQYLQQGFGLTLRQLYYQFVARGFIPNSQKEYGHLGTIINNARLAGLVDWDAVADRTRQVRGQSHWSSPGDIIKSAAHSYHRDKWAGQENYVEVWVEKDALVDIVGHACDPLDVKYLSCRGYTSQSEMWASAMRMVNAFMDDGKELHVIHLGDHDPSGKDMTRDITDRLQLFCEYHGADAPQIHRIALNMDQVNKYRPPPNPAKLTDSRCAEYVANYGDKSWELDALDPKVLSDLIYTEVVALRNGPLWVNEEGKEERERQALFTAASRWMEVEKLLQKRGKK
jgi:hypothetical protein